MKVRLDKTVHYNNEDIGRIVEIDRTRDGDRTFRQFVFELNDGTEICRADGFQKIAKEVREINIEELR